MATPESSGPSDGAAREAALDVTRSFIVQAPAGSGKTELLIQRFLALLARVERPEAIVAMTFTRKAAGEIRERIIEALREAAGGAPPEQPHRALTWRLARAVLERDAALGWELVAHPARLQVHTIDALCAAWMRQAPMAVKLGAMPRLIERAEALHAQAARAELDAAGESSARLAAPARLSGQRRRSADRAHRRDARPARSMAAPRDRRRCDCAPRATRAGTGRRDRAQARSRRGAAAGGRNAADARPRALRRGAPRAIRSRTSISPPGRSAARCRMRARNRSTTGARSPTGCSRRTAISTSTSTLRRAFRPRAARAMPARPGATRKSRR